MEVVGGRMNEASWAMLLRSCLLGTGFIETFGRPEGIGKKGDEAALLSLCSLRNMGCGSHWIRGRVYSIVTLCDGPAMVEGRGQW